MNTTADSHTHTRETELETVNITPENMQQKWCQLAIKQVCIKSSRKKLTNAQWLRKG